MGLEDFSKRFLKSFKHFFRNILEAFIAYLKVLQRSIKKFAEAVTRKWFYKVAVLKHFRKFSGRF